MDRPTLHSIVKEGQKPKPEEPEEELNFDVEVSSAANVFRFFEEYFNVVGDGTAKVTESDGLCPGAYLQPLLQAPLFGSVVARDLGNWIIGGLSPAGGGRFVAVPPPGK